MATKEKTGRQVIAETKRGINARMIGGGAGATKTALRRTLEDRVHAVNLMHACQIAGIASIRCATADELFDLLYGLTWCAAYKRQLAEYYATPWGQDMGAASEQLELAA